MSDSITQKVIDMAGDTEKIAKLDKHEEEAIQRALSGMITKLINSVAKKFGIPAIILSMFASGAASYAGNPDAATKEDVTNLNATMEKGFGTAQEERQAIRTRLTDIEKDNIKLTLELGNLHSNFDEYKRTHP